VNFSGRFVTPHIRAPLSASAAVSAQHYLLGNFTELATGTTATGGKRGFDVQSRVAIVFMMEADAVAPCASRHST
jgi:hypothetical protein